MTTWKPHALAKPHPNQVDFRRGDKVEASIDLPGVPAGTAGRVILANGFNWLRCRVQFANGVEIGDLDGRQLVPTGKALRRIGK